MVGRIVSVWVTAAVFAPTLMLLAIAPFVELNPHRRAILAAERLLATPTPRPAPSTESPAPVSVRSDGAATGQATDETLETSITAALRAELQMDVGPVTCPEKQTKTGPLASFECSAVADGYPVGVSVQRGFFGGLTWKTESVLVDTKAVEQDLEREIREQSGLIAEADCGTAPARLFAPGRDVKCVWRSGDITRPFTYKLAEDGIGSGLMPGLRSTAGELR